jgi:nickel-dependent lactate racemase
VEADLRIVTGLIEPHFMAGFSGGRKGICPALVDLRTVQRFHGFGIMADPNSVEGRLEGNPCHEESLRVARIVGCDFLVNVAITHDRRPAAIFAGHMETAHLAGCRQVAEWNTALIGGPFDLVVTSSGGYPLDKNFYQSVKGMVTALPALHEGSTMVVLSACSEIGSPEYTETMRQFGHDPAGFLREIAGKSEVVKDQWQYQMHCRVLSRIGRERLLLGGDGLPAEVLSGLAVTPVGGVGDVRARVQGFVDSYCARNPGAKVAVIPDGPYTMVRRG